MADPMGPNLLVLGGDNKRLEWLRHHATSQWPSARVTPVPAADAASLNRLLAENAPDAVMLLVDFADAAASDGAVGQLIQMLQLQPALHCIVLAENGGESSAVRSLKSGAKDYLPLARISRDQLLGAITEAWTKRFAAAQAARAARPPAPEGSGIDVPGYSIVKEIATSNFSQVFLARSERLRRNVVLKVMNRGQSSREIDDAERFQREYEIISSITHRAIAEI